MCAGAAHGDSNIDRGEEIREIRQVGAAALWAALVNREDIFAIADRLALSPDEPVDAWRLVILRIARSDAFMQTAPQDVPMTRDDWERWKALEASPRKLLSLLRKLIYGVRIWD